ncbi:MAG TPA: spore germination protein, partial [Sporolactobacillaceae bacterium]|nr:spore germination protein [Sporolactobacillaceae bacterium]
MIIRLLREDVVRMRSSRREKGKTKEKNKVSNLKDLIKLCNTSDDFKSDVYQTQVPQSLWVDFFQPLVDTDVLHKDILKSLELQPHFTLEDIQRAVPIEDFLITSDASKAKEKLMNGFVMIRLNEDDEACILLSAESKQQRQISFPEVEFSVVGPKEAFVESLSTNLNLIRKRIPTPDLKIKELIVGKLSKTKVAVVSIDGITNEENRNTVIQRIQAIDFDQIIDSSYITQMISDNQRSPFPQLLDTERPDRVAAVLAEG